MPTKYPQYVMSGRTRLGEEYFNPIWRDLDGRLLALEALRISWLAAVQELTDFGLERIDAALQPIVAQLQADVDAALAALEQLSGVVSDVEWKWVEPADSAAYAYDGGLLETVTETISDARSRVTALAYDVDGNVETVTETIGSESWVTTYTYSGDQITGMSRVEAV